MIEILVIGERAGESFLYRMVIPRAPVVGDKIKGPDDFPMWTVRGVLFDYWYGFDKPPRVLVDVDMRGARIDG